MRSVPINWYRFGIAVLLISMCLLGCRGAVRTCAEVDTSLVRSSSKAQRAYAEGDLDQAIQKYREALMRAWAIDDPYESGINAYNLATCMTTLGSYTQAKRWLVESRAELCRAGASTGNTWLLQAKIAHQENFYDDAAWFLDLAQLASPPCVDGQADCSCHGDDACRDGCLASLPCVGAKFRAQQADQECEDSFEAQIHLMRARLAAEKFELAEASAHLQLACEFAGSVGSADLQAELHHVAALIHLAKGEFLQAARHFDQEAHGLRAAGTYREVPGALELAAAAYQQAEQHQLAVNRSGRVARIWLGRGNATKAWQIVQRTSDSLQIVSCESERIRYALLADEIARTLESAATP